MRPYAGVGLVLFSPDGKKTGQEQALPLYEEPGLTRVGMLDRSRSSGNDWIFGQSYRTLPLIVSARKGDWLRVYYDDAGREAWMDSRYRGRFHSWEQFMKLKNGRMLPGLQPHYYRLQQRPGGKQLAILTPKQLFKVLKMENAWGMVLTDQSQIGWLRWRDEDGRLLVGPSH